MVKAKINPARLPASPYPATPVIKKPEIPEAVEKYIPRKTVKIGTWRSWSPARDAIVMDMVKAGKTQQQIADELGVTKSAINKRVARLRARGHEF